jgi:hypothetical protein
MSGMDGYGLANIPVAPISVRECRFLPGPHYWACCIDAQAPIDLSEEGAFLSVSPDDVSDLLETPPMAIEINPHGPRGWPASGLRLDAPFGSVEVHVTHDYMPSYTEGETRVYRGPGGRELLVYVGDRGDQIEFREEIGSAQPLSVEWRGQSLAGALLGLNRRRPDDVVAFFRAFGAPRERGRMDMADLRWEQVRLADTLEGPRLLSDLPGLSGLQQRRYFSPSFGELHADAEGSPVLVANLWELARLSLTLERRQGRIGFCEAPAPWGSGPCGKPFIAARLGRRRFCSPECQSRASSRRAYARIKDLRRSVGIAGPATG